MLDNFKERRIVIELNCVIQSLEHVGIFFTATLKCFDNIGLWIESEKSLVPSDKKTYTLIPWGYIKSLTVSEHDDILTDFLEPKKQSRIGFTS